MILAFSILVFVAVALGVAGAVVHRAGAGGRLLQQRLRGASAGPAPPGIEVERDVRYSAVPWLDRLLRALNLGEHLELLLYQGGMRIRAGALVLLTAVFALAGYIGGVATFHRVAPGLLFLALVGPAPYLYALYRKSQRMRAFAKEFPDALDLLVSGLRAGLSFSAAMQIVSEESPEPVRSEFAITVEEQSLGLDFREALVNLTKRVDSLDLRFFVTAVVLQRDTGGNLAEILENTARLIRDRFRVLGDIQTFTAHGRLTGGILMLLPLGMALYTWALNPDYFRPMIETPNGRLALIVAGGMQVIGMLVIRRIVNIRV